MKYLESVKVVQFFLYEKADIPVRQITGIFGPNGTGKSSILDAIQIAVFGANSRLVALNAQADETTTTRSLRAYCLGQYGDSAEHRARDNATTYITLVWRDSVTKEPVSTGVCLYASSDRERHEVLGRYVLRNIELSASDHVERVDGQERPRDWSSFRQQIVERAKVSGDEALFNDSDRYIRALLLALRGSGGASASEAFTRAFRFGLRMRFDKTVDQIVRDEVLESRPTKIKKFKDLTESFQRLAELVKHVEDKITEGEAVTSEFAKAALDSSRSATWSALSLASAREMANEKKEAAIQDRIRAEEEHLRKQAERQKSIEAIAHAQSEVTRLRSLRESHAAHRDYGALQTDIDQATGRIASSTKDLRQHSNLVRHRLIDASKSEHLSAMASDLLAGARTLEMASDRITTMAANELDALLRPAARLIASAINTLFTIPGAIGYELTELRKRLREEEENLVRAKAGRAKLSDHVHRLLTELRDHGLSPKPVCDLVRISDPEWQPVIEGYLGPHREALLAPTGEESDTFAHYRRLTLYGVKVGMESRQKLDWRPKPGTVAELIEGDWPAAVAYLRTKFGDILRASSDAEALAGARTLTKDGMFVSGGDIDRIRPLASSQLCIGATGSDQRAQIQLEISRLKSEIAKLEQKQSQVKQLVDALMIFGGEDTLLTKLLAFRDEIRKATEKKDLLEHRLADSADEEYVRLGKELNQMEGWLREMEPKVSDLALDVGRLEGAVTQAQGKERDAELCCQEAAQAADTSSANEEYNAAFASDQWDILLEKCNGSYRDMAAHCDNQVRLAEQRKSGAVARGTGELGKFLQKHREQVGREVADDWRRAHVWMQELISRLRSTDLLDYKAQMDDAYRASQETFRTDVAIALHNNIEWLDQSIDRLNKALMSCPAFSNGERYQFTRKVRPQLEGVLKFIKDVASHGPDGDLFGDAAKIPEQFKDLLDDKVAPGASGTRSPLDDYREFYEFDIEILREDPITKLTKRIGYLSKRIGPGSGGEHRAPLYVIAGAALASAYRLDEIHRDGMGLILLDEAFNKMDITNIMATMRYLEDLGLQVVLASPGENLGTLTAFLHRYYDFQKDPDNNVISIEGHDVSAETRAMFRDDMPDFNPELLAAELSTISSVNRPSDAVGDHVA